MKSEKPDELLPLEELRLDEAPAGVGRRAFMMRYKEPSEGGLAVAVVLC